MLGAVFISTSAIIFKHSGVGPVTGAFFRTAYAVPVLFVLWWPKRKVDGRSRGDRLLALASGAAFAADVIAWHAGIGYIGAGLATLIANSQVLMVTFMAWALYRHRPSTAVFLSLPLVLVGLTFVTGLGRTDTFGARPVLGVLLGVVSAVFYSAFLIMFRHSALRVPAAPVGPLLDATAGAALTVLVFGLATGSIAFQPSWPAHGWLLTLALSNQVLGWLVIGYALPRLPPTVTSFLITVQPVITMGWGVLAFDERVSLLQGVGVALVLAGITWVSVRGSLGEAAATVLE
jgi:drug/metabolite transporter (DMT)-like permease